MAQVEFQKEVFKEVFIENQKEVIIEKYKEVSANRRHYSALRFALLPFYLAIQGAIANAAFGKDSSLPYYLCCFAGIISTYVFFTIEYRISEYYTYLGKVGAELEKQLNLGERMFGNWPKSKFISNTNLSIIATYIICALFWLAYLIIKLRS